MSKRLSYGFQDDNKNEGIAPAMSLLLAARERVLTLSEQRVSLRSVLHLLVLTDIGNSF